VRPQGKQRAINHSIGSFCSNNGALFGWGRAKGMFEGDRIAGRTVKCVDPGKSTEGESSHQGHTRWSRTKVGGSKTIRYRRSPNYKCYKPEIGRCPSRLPLDLCGNVEQDSGGSMVARLKLKGIDGRAHKEWNLRLNLTQHGTTHTIRTQTRRTYCRYFWIMRIVVHGRR